LRIDPARRILVVASLSRELIKHHCDGFNVKLAEAQPLPPIWP